MEACNSTSCPFDAPRGFLDVATFHYLTITIRIFINSAMALLAFCASLISISTFSKTNLRQGVNLSLLILSCSDFGTSFLAVLIQLCYIMIWHGYRVLNGFSFSITLWNGLFGVNYPVNFSIVVTTAIAIVRCLSVVMPMKFKTIITNERQVIAIAIAGCISISVPLYIHINWFYFSPNTNSTSSGLEYLQRYPIYAIFRNTLFYAGLIINVCSIALLIVSLKRSATFQFQSSSQQAKPGISRKETQAMKTVILVLAIFVGCNMPLMLLALLRQAIPEFIDTARYRYEKVLLDMIVAFSLTLNIVLNLFAYYFTNSTFRKMIFRINSNNA